MVKEHIRKKYHGLAALEMALVLPLLLLLALGAIRYGHMLLLAQEMTNAARNAARTASRADATNQDGIDVARAMLENVGIDPGAAGNTVDVATVALRDDGSWDPAVTAEDQENGNIYVSARIIIPVANVTVLNVPLFTNFEPEGMRFALGINMKKEQY
jgi:Flp pilus assembly protein TadG